MAHIKVKEDAPGIRGLFAFSPETAKPLVELVEAVKAGPTGAAVGGKMKALLNIAAKVQKDARGVGAGGSGGL